MSDETALAVQDLTVREIGMMCVKSGFFQDAEQEAQAIIKILAGREAGLQPIESMTGIHIIKGKITFGANMMAAAVKKHPNYDYRVVSHTDKECVIDFFEVTYDLKDRIPKKEKIGQSSFTMKEADTITHWDAKKAKEVALSSGAQWKNYPKAMLFARAMSSGVRYYCPDVFGHSPVYVPEEMGADVDADGEPIDITPKESKPVKNTKVKQCKDCGGAIPNGNESGFCAMCMGNQFKEGITTTKPEMGYYDSGGTDHAYDPPEESRNSTVVIVEPTGKYEPPLDAEPVEEEDFFEEEKPKSKDKKAKKSPSTPEPNPDQGMTNPPPEEYPDEPTHNTPKSEDVMQLPPSIMDKIKACTTAREAFTLIDKYTFSDGQGKYLKRLVDEYCPQYNVDGFAKFMIPESAVIVIVKEASGVKFKKSETTPTCKNKGCKNKMTEPEAEEHDNVCFDCFKKVMED